MNYVHSYTTLYKYVVCSALLHTMVLGSNFAASATYYYKS